MPENHRLEYKQQLNESLEKEVVAFLNYLGGGIIYIGLDNNGQVIGIDNSDSLQLQIKDRIKNNISPSCLGLFDVIEETREGKSVIKIIIASGQERPYYLKKYGMSEKGAFIRKGSAAEPMTSKMIEELFAKRIRNSIGKIKSPRQDLKFEQLRIYYDSADKTLNSQFQKTLELINEDGKLNYVAYLLADNNNISVKVARYRAEDRVDLIQSEEFGFCSLIKATKQVLDKIEVENKTFTKITPKERIERKQWNTLALREAVINAMVHNDYTYELAPKFEFFSDRFEVTSYGGLPQGLSKDEFFQGISIPRNKELMRVFRDMELVEQLGSGIPRILISYGKECFHFSENYIRMSFPISLKNEQTVGETVGETARGILIRIKENPYVTREELSKQLNITVRGVEYNLRKLKKMGILVREGSTKSGKWIVVTKK